MRIDVDHDRCEGHGLCEVEAPGLFSLDDDGELTYAYDGADVPPDLEPAAQGAIRSCPVAALRLAP